MYKIFVDKVSIYFLFPCGFSISFGCLLLHQSPFRAVKFFFIDFARPVFEPPSIVLILFCLKENVLGKCHCVSLWKIDNCRDQIFFHVSSSLSLDFISDISSCFFDRCFLHQSAPTEAWRITLNNPTKTWSLGSNQVPLSHCKLLWGGGVGGWGEVQCLQDSVYKSAKTVWVQTSYIYLFKNFFEGWAGMWFFSRSADFSRFGNQNVYLRDQYRPTIEWFLLLLPFTSLRGGI